MIQRYFFNRDERLSRKLIIQKLFDEGIIIKIFPLKIFIIILDELISPPAQVLISIPKKNFRKAVHRNLIRRRIREAYRLNKHLLYEKLSERKICLAIAFVYLEVKILDYHEIEKKVRNAISEIARIQVKSEA